MKRALTFVVFNERTKKSKGQTPCGIITGGVIGGGDSVERG